MAVIWSAEDIHRRLCAELHREGGRRKVASDIVDLEITAELVSHIRLLLETPREDTCHIHRHLVQTEI